MFASAYLLCKYSPELGLDFALPSSEMSPHRHDLDSKQERLCLLLFVYSSKRRMQEWALLLRSSHVVISLIQGHRCSVFVLITGVASQYDGRICTHTVSQEVGHITHYLPAAGHLQPLHHGILEKKSPQTWQRPILSRKCPSKAKLSNKNFATSFAQPRNDSTKKPCRKQGSMHQLNIRRKSPVQNIPTSAIWFSIVTRTMALQKKSSKY